MELVNARSIFSPATGFLKRVGFAWTCNPYLGCSFGCNYCYAMFLPQNRRPRAEWGKWFQAKINAVQLASQQAHKTRGNALYMSSVTDPYLPAERTLALTRGILEAILPYQPRLLVQTRGPLVTRDIDLLCQFRNIRINFSIPTDSEAIRQVFEPKAPRLEHRWRALGTLRSAGLPVGICVTPMLPLENGELFIRRVVKFDPDVLVVQDFHDSGGAFGADTSEKARQLLEGLQWNDQSYRRCLLEFRRHRKDTYEGEAGFFPPGDVDRAIFPEAASIDLEA